MRMHGRGTRTHAVPAPPQSGRWVPLQHEHQVRFPSAAPRLPAAIARATHAGTVRHALTPQRTVALAARRTLQLVRDALVSPHGCVGARLARL